MVPEYAWFQLKCVLPSLCALVSRSPELETGEKNTCAKLCLFVALLRSDYVTSVFLCCNAAQSLVLLLLRSFAAQVGLSPYQTKAGASGLITHFTLVM